MSKLFALFSVLLLAVGIGAAQTNRFPPINLALSNPQGASCAAANQIEQYGGNFYVCNGSVWVLADQATEAYPQNALTTSTALDPVDPTGTVDSTVGLQNAINAISPIGGTLRIPYGTYNISAPLVIASTKSVTIEGDGRGATILQAIGSGWSGQPMLLVSNSYRPTIKDITFLGDTSSNPHAAIEFYVPTGFTIDSSEAQLYSVTIGTQSCSSSQFVYGVTWEHASGADDNNDQATITNVDNYCDTTAAYLITGGNSVWHHFISGHSGSTPQTWHVEGGSLVVDGMRGAVTDVAIDFECPPYTTDSGYEYGSSFTNLHYEGIPQLMRTGNTACTTAGSSSKSPGPYEVEFRSAHTKGGAGTGAYWIDFESFSPTPAVIRPELIIDGGEMGFGAANYINVTDTDSEVVIENANLQIAGVNYGGSLTSMGNNWSFGAAPTFTSTNGGSHYNFCQISDRMGNTPTYIPSNCSDMSIGGSAGSLSGSSGLAFSYIGLGGGSPLSTTPLDIAPNSSFQNALVVDSSNMTITNGHLMLVKNGSNFYFDITDGSSGVPTGLDIANGLCWTFFSGNETSETAKLCASNGNLSLNRLNQEASGKYAGTVTVSASTTGTVTFSPAYASAPVCLLTPTADPTATGVYWVTTSTTTLTANVKVSGTITFNYACFGNPN